MADYTVTVTDDRDIILQWSAGQLPGGVVSALNFAIAQHIDGLRQAYDIEKQALALEYLQAVTLAAETETKKDILKDIADGKGKPGGNPR